MKAPLVLQAGEYIVVSDQVKLKGIAAPPFTSFARKRRSVPAAVKLTRCEAAPDPGSMAVVDGGVIVLICVQPSSPE